MKKSRQKERRGKSSSTPGREKSDNCQKTPEKVQFCKDHKMYKREPSKYKQVEDQVRKLNK